MSSTATLASRLDHFPEAWKPKPGEKLIGEIVDVDMRESEYGEPYPILVVLDADGREWAWHAFHTIARREVAKQKPQIGETVGIAYHGKGVAAPGMNAPERWRLIVEREKAAPVDWETLPAAASEAADEPAPDDSKSKDEPAGDDIPF